jgi:RNA polymerase sigma factor (sigma-70 family)
MDGDEIYRRYVGQVRTIARTRGRSTVSPVDREDLVQNTFLRLFEALEKKRIVDGPNLAPYIRTVALNLVNDAYRTGRRELLCEDLDNHGAETDGPDLLSQWLAILEQCVGALPPELRLLYDLRFVGRMTQSRAAGLLGISRQRLRTLESRLKNEVASRLAPHEG